MQYTNSGVTFGCKFTVNVGDNTKIDIGEGNIIFVDNSVPRNGKEIPIYFEGIEGVDADIGVGGVEENYIGLKLNAQKDGVEVVVQPNFTSEERRSIVQLGNAWGIVGTGEITGYNISTQTVFNTGNDLLDLIEARGSDTIYGNEFSANGANTLLDRSAGKSFRHNINSLTSPDNVNMVVSSAAVGITSYDYFLVGSDVADTLATIDTTRYDNSGSWDTMPAGKWKIDDVYYYPGSNIIAVLPGQMLYDNPSHAKNNILHDSKSGMEHAAILKPAVLRAYVIVKQGATDLSDSAQCIIVNCNKDGFPLLYSDQKPLSIYHLDSPDGLVDNCIYSDNNGDLTAKYNMTVEGNLTVTGDTFATESETVLVNDNHLLLNNGHITTTAETAGLKPIIKAVSPLVQSAVTAGTFTTGEAGVSNPTVIIDTADKFSQYDVVHFTGFNTSRCGLFEVHSNTGTTLILKGIGTVANTQDFFDNNFASGTDTGTITKVEASILRAGIDGAWETAVGSESDSISFIDLFSTPTYTTGSALFAGASGEITQDNTNFFWDNTAKRLGIGNNNPNGTVNITTTDSGASPHSNANDLVVESQYNAGISILSDNSSYSRFAFGSPSKNTGALLSWSYVNDAFRINTDKSTAAIQFAPGSNALAGKVSSGGDWLFSAIDQTPKGLVHICNGASGATVSSVGNDLVIENTVNTGLSLLSNNNSYSRILFGSTSDATGAGFLWGHDANLFKIFTNKTGAEVHFSPGSEAFSGKTDSTGKWLFSATNQTPLGLVHISSGDSGVTTANTSVDDFIVENSSQCGMSLLTADDEYTRIGFGSPSATFGAGFRWNYDDLEFNIFTNTTGGEIHFRPNTFGFAGKVDDTRKWLFSTTDQTPKALVHISTGTTGVTPGTSHDDLIVENSGNAGVSILTSDTGYSTLVLGSSSLPAGATMTWRHDSNAMRFNTYKTGANIEFRTDNNSFMGKFDYNHRVLFGTTNRTPKGTLNVATGESGVTPNPSYDDLVVEAGNAVAGMSILAAGTSNSAGISFGNATNSLHGQMLVNPSANVLYIVANSNAAIRMLAGGQTSLQLSGSTGTVTSVPTLNNTTTSSSNMYINPSSGTIYRSTSSRLIKENIDYTGVDDQLVFSFKPASFDQISNGDHLMGFIAEDMKELDVRLVDDTGEEDFIIGLQTNAIMSATVAGLQYVKTEQDRLKDEITNQQATIMELIARITALENA